MFLVIQVLDMKKAWITKDIHDEIHSKSEIHHTFDLSEPGPRSHANSEIFIFDPRFHIESVVGNLGHKCQTIPCYILRANEFRVRIILCSVFILSTVAVGLWVTQRPRQHMTGKGL